MAEQVLTTNIAKIKPPLIFQLIQYMVKKLLVYIFKAQSLDIWHVSLPYGPLPVYSSGVPGFTVGQKLEGLELIDR